LVIIKWRTENATEECPGSSVQRVVVVVVAVVFVSVFMTATMRARVRAVAERWGKASLRERNDRARVIERALTRAPGARA
jgi:hypothetical protein